MAASTWPCFQSTSTISPYARINVRSDRPFEEIPNEAPDARFERVAVRHVAVHEEGERLLCVEHDQIARALSPDRRR